MIPEQKREPYAASVRAAESALAKAVEQINSLPGEIVTRLGPYCVTNSVAGIQGLRTALRCMLAMDSCEDDCPHRDLPYYGILLPQQHVTDLPKAS